MVVLTSRLVQMKPVTVILKVSFLAITVVFIRLVLIRRTVSPRNLAAARFYFKAMFGAATI